MPLHQGEILKRLVDNQSKPNEEVASQSGIAISSLYNYYNMEDIPAKKLRIICTVLNVDYVKTFIQPPAKKDVTGLVNDDGKNTGDEVQMSQIIKLLKQQIEQQNEILKLLRKK